MADTFYDNGLQFTCKQCSGCCRHDPGFVYLSQVDIKNLCLALSINKSELIKKYCRVVPYYDGTEVLSLLEKENYDCIFWDNGCTVYTGRPIQCSTYPFWTFLLDNEARWNQESNSCPGINSGCMLNKNEICDILLTYKNNMPLRVSSGIDSEDTI